MSAIGQADLPGKEPGAGSTEYDPGAYELLKTIDDPAALRNVFNTPYDRIVWDVGHQTYPHKILTGRREAMARLRMIGGISGFPRRSESEYDTFGKIGRAYV